MISQIRLFRVHNAILEAGETEIDQFSIKFAVDNFAMKTLNENIKSPLKIYPYICVHIK